MIGNLLGDRHQEARMGDPVEAVLEPHADAGRPYALVHRRRR